MKIKNQNIKKHCFDLKYLKKNNNNKVKIFF